MAYVFANFSFDQNDLNLNRVYTNAWQAGLFDNSYLSFNGATYQDSYVVDWYLGGYLGSVFAGEYITVDYLQNVM